MCSTTWRVEASIGRIILVSGLVAASLAALACGDSRSLPGRDSLGGGNPLAPSFELRGIVTDTAGAPVAGAKVAGSVGGSPAFTALLTGSDGRFETSTTATRVQLQVSKDGYSIEERAVTLPATDLTFRLARFEGKTLVFTASPSCSLYQEAKSRRYVVSVEVRDGAIAVRVLNAQGIPYAADLGFAGTRDGNRVTFTLVDDAFRSDLAFVELVAQPQWEFALGGTASGTMSENGMSLTFDGRVQVRSWGSTVTYAECTASDHRLEIVQ